jgi:hypothetical protein
MLHRLRVSISFVISSQFDPRAVVHSTAYINKAHPLLKREKSRGNQLKPRRRSPPEIRLATQSSSIG